MLFSTAFAQTAGGASDFQSTLQQFLPLILIAGVFYFLLIRPQQQRAKQLKAAVAALRRGDKIVTAGGIIASVSRVINDDEVEVEIAQNVKIRVVRSTISTILSKPEPAKGGKAEKDIPTKAIEDAIEEIDAEAEAKTETPKKRRVAARPVAKTAEPKAEATPAETETKPADGAN